MNLEQSSRYYLVKNKACREAVQWTGERTLEQAWTECERGDWMLWLAVKVGVDHRLVSLAACDCAKTAWQYCDDETRAIVMSCDRVTRAWCDGRADIEDVRVGRSAAAAATDATATAGHYAAIAAVAAADAAIAIAAADVDAGAVAAADAADAAADAADAAAGGAADVARKVARIGCVRIIRERIPVTLIAAAINSFA